MNIDTTFDFRTDAAGRDPDTYSATLRRYHRFLWSKTLPDGRLFQLDDTTPGVYLRHQFEGGEFMLASDTVIPTFTHWRSLRHIVQLSSEEENEAFRRVGYTIGGMMIFPANRIGGRMTINGARGFNAKISDRLDLTLECIRRHYQGESSPLSETLSRYSDFFSLFETFDGYVEFFLLQDLIKADRSSVDFFLPFDEFNTAARPTDIHTYVEYRHKSITFIEARNRRISQFSAQFH